MIACIVGSGSITDYNFYREFVCGPMLVIATDGGTRHLEKLKIFPDIILGDMDSIDADLLSSYKDRGVFILQYPAEKDFTDTSIAARLLTGEEKALLPYEIETKLRVVDEVRMFGCSGTRMDHTLVNISLLTYFLDRDLNAWIINENNLITAIKQQTTIQKREGCKLSLFTLTEITNGITLKGLKYPLFDYDLHYDNQIAVSNEFIDNSATIHFKKGRLLVMLSND